MEIPYLKYMEILGADENRRQKLVGEIRGGGNQGNDLGGRFRKGTSAFKFSGKFQKGTPALGLGGMGRGNCGPELRRPS
ncbi:hypothetical protein AGMMS49587_14490 [Spirochaetia bacterium]|nr:hypothetical protein AGMMS49587_14490 [Spirochaetia bacterium]